MSVSVSELEYAQLENGLKAKAIEYLKYLYALEVLAGANFGEIWRDLHFFRDYAQDQELMVGLRTAGFEEGLHAGMVLDILSKMGENLKSECISTYKWLEDVLDNSCNGCEPDTIPYVKATINYVMERQFAEGGCGAMYEAMVTMAGTLHPREGAQMRASAYNFYMQVMQDEVRHVALGERVTALYKTIYPDLNMDAVLRSTRANGSPFRRAIRAKLDFFKAARELRETLAACVV